MNDLRDIDREVEKIKDWLTWSNIGDKFIYYQGFLAGDMKEEDPKVVRLAKRIQEVVNELYETKEVTLTQRKVDEESYEYIAIKIAIKT
jgi:hypothetical protein